MHFQMYRTLFIPTAFLFIFFSASWLYAQDHSEHSERVRQLIRFHQYDEALDVLKSIPSAEQDYYRGYIHFHRGQPSDAARHLQNAIKNNHDNLHAHLLLGHSFSMTGRDEDAIAQYLEYAKNDPLTGNHFAAVRAGKRFLPSASNFQVRLSPLSSQAHDVAAFTLDPDGIIVLSFRSDIRRRQVISSLQEGAEAFLAGSASDPRPTHYHGDLNRQLHAAPFFMLPDGNTVIFSRYSLKPGLRPSSATISAMQIYTAQVSDAGNWERERAMPFSAEWNDGIPALSSAGDRVIFASDRPGGYGGFDLYVSYRTAGGWSAPVNLGPEVNTPGDELFPYLDGNVLYFASDWHPGFGGFDIFRTEQQNGKWSRPTNMGPEINSSYDDYAFTYRLRDGKAFFVSNRPSAGNAANIYEAVPKTVDYLLVVTDRKTGKPLQHITAGRTGTPDTEYAAESGQYFRFTHQGAVPAAWNIQAPGYQNEAFRIEYPGQVISLELASQTFTPFVLLDQYRQPVGDALVEWTVQGSNTGGQAFSGRDGRFGIPGQNPGTEVRLQITRRGYENTTLPVTITTDRPIEVRMQKEEMPVVMRGADEFRSSFMIRLGAFRSPDLSKMQELQNLGELVHEQRDGLMVISLAGYNSRSEAEAALPEIHRRGYESAFIIIPPGETGSPAPAITPAATHRIQIGVFSMPDRVDVSRLPADLTIHRVIRPGGATALQAGDFTSREEAARRLAAVQSAGFPEAFIVDINP